MESMAERLKLDAELSEREEEVLKRVATGSSAKEIGNDMFISPHTANNFIASIKSKTGAQKNTELSVFFFCRKFKIPVAAILSCALMLLAVSSKTFDIRRCRVRERLETSTRRMSRDDALY